MKTTLFRQPCQWALAGLLLLNSSAFSADSDSPRERLSLNRSWRFIKGDPAGLGDQLGYAKLKDWILPSGAEFTPDPVAARQSRPAGNPGGEASYVQTEFNDTAWRQLNLPHDWAVEGPFGIDLDGDTGKLPWMGIGWYRKHFTLPAADQGRRIFVDFDGAMANATVWLNGQFVGGWPYGYNGFRLELTDKLKWGTENVLAVRLDTDKWGSRWYPGAGIYRNVWLVKTESVHVAHWGVEIITPTISADKGEVKIVVALDNQSAQSAAASVQAEIFEISKADVAGKKAGASARPEIQIAAGGTGKVGLTASVPNPKLWDIATPNRYLARLTVSAGGKVVDVYDQPFGFRTFDFTHDDGFHLNGKRVQLQGTCNHHDLGALGGAFNRRAQERQLEILKEMGDNALRTSHNPPAPELLDLADKMGFVVMCEAFDCWRAGKKTNDYSVLFDQWKEKDLLAMVRRERNHPSIILWSTGNEIHEQYTANPAKELRDIIHAEDPTRPVSAGVWDAAARNDFRQGVDIQGVNYGINKYEGHLKFPGNENRPFYASESSSCISSRGEYFFPVKRGSDSRVNFQISSYDVDAPDWACTPDEEFAALDHYPAFAGEFVWTGFDYLGEPTPYNKDLSNLLNIHDQDPVKVAAMKKELEELGRIRVPSRSSYFGIVDLCGFKKDRFYSYQARWRPDFPMAHLLPHWNWLERVGQVTPVHVYTSGDAAELFLNGRSLGLKKKGQFEYRLRWDDVVYQPGELKVVAYKNGKKWAADTVKTTGPAAKLRLEADRSRISADGRDLSFVTVNVADQDGLLVPRSKNHIQFSLEGPGEIIATDNGDATSFESFQAKERNAYNGKALVIIRSQVGESGTLVLNASSPGLGSDRIKIRTGLKGSE